jgi:hypothetical protein
MVAAEAFQRSCCPRRDVVSRTTAENQNPPTRTQQAENLESQKCFVVLRPDERVLRVGAYVPWLDIQPVVRHQTCAAERCGTHAADEVPKDILLVSHIVLGSVAEKYNIGAVKV